MSKRYQPRYQVLARKYRPQAFREVVGQEAVVTTLKNGIRFDRVAYAYLFCGSRGVGKTTLARLFAKALNCASPTADIEPCNQCPSCLEITAGQSLDVLEIDGASHRGIDDIRQINETVAYAPSHGKYKIYIIDEVHMLTKEAFNALLKTLEEPPDNVKFFFATTEPHKVLPTIISRCQRFDLARISPSLITDKLRQIAIDLSRIVDLEALDLIATFSEGSLRDAESLFDQILCFAEGTITAATVRQSLGLVSQELFASLDQAFSEYRLAYAFELTDQLFQNGKDLAHFLEQLIEHYRNLTLSKTLATPHPSAKLYTQQQCLHILDLLIKAETTFQTSPFPRIALEALLLQIIRSKHRIPIEVLIRHLTELPSSPEKLSPQEPPPALEKNDLATEPLPASPLEKKNLVTGPFPQEPLPASPPIDDKPPPPVIEPLPEPQGAELPFEKKVPTFPSEPKKVELPAPPLSEKKPPAPFAEKHPSHYDTLIRFAAVELEGTVKN